MFELSKLESLAFDLERTDQFHDCYVKMLAEAAVARDIEKMKALRAILHKQVAFVALEMVKAKKEESESEEIVQ